MLLTRYNTSLLQNDNVENIGEINNSLMIKAVVTKHILKIGQLKDDSVYLLNDTTYILQDKPLENFISDDNKIDENIEKVLLLTTELLEKIK